jgi:S1-C subfamily serine protease
VTLKLKCPACGEIHQVPDDMMGKKIACRSCNATLRVPAAKPTAAGDVGSASLRTDSGTNSPAETGYSLEPEPQAAVAATAAPRQRPTVTEDTPKPAKTRPQPTDVPARGGLPAWIYGSIGAGAVLVLAAAALLIRSFAGSAPARYPDPAVDVVLAIASPTAPEPAPALAATKAAPSKPANGGPATAKLAVAAPLASLGTKMSNPPAASAVATTPAPAPGASPAPSVAGGPLTTAQIVARWEPSVALVKGSVSSGTGFVVKPGIIVTNAHVIGEELISGVEIHFPSAPADKQGPLPAELLYEDPKRDLAFLKVATDLPVTQVIPSYTFVKGEDITVIGNPGLGDDVVLENAISRGVMSSKTTIEGMNFLQLSMSVNPGNSGGPVFDSSGQVIGVVTLKAAKAEALAFCVPADELQAALAQVGPARPDVVSQHRAQVTFKLLTSVGALYGVGLDIRAALLRKSPPGTTPNLLPNESIQKLDQLITTLDEKVCSAVIDEVADIKTDPVLAPMTRTRYQDLATTYEAMRELYASTNRPSDQYSSQVQAARAKHLRLVESLQKDLKSEVPAQILAIMKTRVIDGQSAAVVSQIVPGSVQSRILQGRLSPRGPIGSRKANIPGRAPTLRERVQDRRAGRLRGGN